MKFIGCAGLIALMVAGAVQAQNLPPRRSFDIVTGAAAGSHFPVGEAIARAVSHPPGLMRCERNPVCGPPGVIVTARSSDGVVANVLAVDDASAASGLAETETVAAALAGAGDFAKQGRKTRLKVMADLYGETLQLVAGRKIRSIADLKGRRVSLGVAGSGTAVLAERVLAAYGVRRVKKIYEPVETSGGLLREGRLEAFFVLAPAPAPLVADMVGRGQAKLLPLEGRGRKKLLAAAPGLTAAVMPAIGKSPPLATVGTDALWIVGERAPADVVYGLVRALYHPANRALLADAAATPVRLPDAATLARLPLHPGAAHYYREIGLLK